MAAPDLLDRLVAGWRAYALIAALTLAAALPGVFAMPPLDRDESRFAQASLQMLETGDFVRIAVQDQPRNKKPVGIHWLQAAAVAAFSSPGAHAIWAYRLPSLAGALMAALAAFWGGAPLIGRRGAALGAALLGCCLLLSTEAMIAKTDAALCGFTTLAMAALARLRAPGARPRALAALFWAAVAAGALVKGPITPLVCFGAVAVLCIWERRADWLKPLASPAGPALALAIAAPWAVAIALATHGRFFTDAIGGDLGSKVGGGDEGHSGPPGFHAALVWLLMFPAAIALPAALVDIWRTLRAPATDDAGRGVRFLIAWAAPIWLVFEALPTKLPHYPLPAYPALALLCGAALVEAFDADRRRFRIGARALATVGCVLFVGVTAYLSTLMPGDDAASARRAAQTLIVGAIALAPAAALIWRARAPLQLALTSCAAVIVFNFAARERILPEARAYLVSAEASNALLRAGLHPRLSHGAGRLTSVGYSEPSFVFLTRTDTRLLAGAAAGVAAQRGEDFIVEARQRGRFEAALLARGLAFTPIGDPVAGHNYSNGDLVSLQPGRVTPGGGASVRSATPGTGPLLRP